MTNTVRRAYAAGTRDSTGRPGRNYWQLWMDYSINARLDVPTSTITGRETIMLRNNSDTALRTIVLRLDQNTFSPTAARLDPMPSTIEITQGMKVTGVTVAGQAVNLNPVLIRGTNPAASGPVAFNLDQTVATIALQNPIPAKGSATLQIDWNFKVPDVQQGRGQRMGRLADSLRQVAQGYPRVAVYDYLRGWDTEQYLGNAEFYNNFGHWDVSLDVPAGWLVGATGVLQNPDAVLSATTRERLTHVLESNDTRSIVGATEMGAGKATAAGDPLVWRFVADTANVFAWATSRSYVWDATRATVPERGSIPVNLLYLPGDTNQFRPAAALARHALEFYSKLWMPYAFPQLTLADGPELGMEYPMFIMSVAGAADHEAGHEWWPMMVSNNETWYGWMDEGFNQFILRGSWSPVMQAGEVIALTHHEKWDGSGYPGGLSGERIPLYGRICAVADVFDALTTNREYRDALSTGTVFRMLESEAGRHFDPQIVRAFLEDRPEVERIKTEFEELGAAGTEDSSQGRRS